MINSILIIQSLLYIPEIYNFELVNLSKDNRYIIDYNGDIIYGLCNLSKFIETKKIEINYIRDSRSIILSVNYKSILVNKFSSIFYYMKNIDIIYHITKSIYLKRINKNLTDKTDKLQNLQTLDTDQIFKIKEDNHKDLDFLSTKFGEQIRKKLKQQSITSNIKHQIINLGLNLSLEERKKYDYCSKYYNKLYLRKLVCYLDKYYTSNEILIKHLTVDNFKSIIRLFENDKNINYSFVHEQINRFFNINLNKVQCPICLQIINSSNFSISTCGHLFCYCCINKYLYLNSININKPTSCPMCRKPLLSNRIYKIALNNNFLKFEDYHYLYLINKLGTKIYFILKFCFENKNKKILIISEYYSFLKKINKCLNFFNLNNLLIDNNQCWLEQKYLINKFNNSIKINILLIHSNNLNIKKMIINCLDYMILSNVFQKRINKYLFLSKIRLRQNFNLVKIIQIYINKTIESF